MLSIKVLGPGCKNCERVQIHAAKAVDELRGRQPELEVAIEKVTDTMTFMEYGLLTTPGLVINEKLVAAGRIPSEAEVTTWVVDAL